MKDEIIAILAHDLEQIAPACYRVYKECLEAPFTFLQKEGQETFILLENTLEAVIEYGPSPYVSIVFPSRKNFYQEPISYKLHLHTKLKSLAQEIGEEINYDPVAALQIHQNLEKLIQYINSLVDEIKKQRETKIEREQAYLEYIKRF